MARQIPDVNYGFVYIALAQVNEMSWYLQWNSFAKHLFRHDRENNQKTYLRLHIACAVPSNTTCLIQTVDRQQRSQRCHFKAFPRETTSRVKLIRLTVLSTVTSDIPSSRLAYFGSPRSGNLTQTLAQTQHGPGDRRQAVSPRLISRL